MLSIKYDLILLFHTDCPFKWGIQLNVKWRRNIIANYDSYARNQLVSAKLFAAQNK